MRRRLAFGAALVLTTTILASPIAAIAPAAAAASCPGPESLVPKAHWSRHTLAKGVRLSEATVHDSRGEVSMHVVRINLGRRAITIEPLMKQLAHRYPLTQLAAGLHHLVAAINTGYFDFITGAPTGPVIENGVPLVISSHHERVVGLDRRKRAESGKVWLDAHLVAGRRRAPIKAVNELHPPNGISVYTGSWGSRKILLRGGSTRLVSASGRTSSYGSDRTVPTGRGYLLVARGTSAQHRLASLGTNTAVTVTGGTHTNARRPFAQAYGVGAVLVRHGKSRRGFTCESANTKTPARTAVGFAHHGRTLVMTIVADHPHTSLHGLDNTQMSKLMAQLGVRKAFDFDGSGSSELLARMPHGSGLSMRNYPADGAQRPMPLGLGVFVGR